MTVGPGAGEGAPGRLLHKGQGDTGSCPETVGDTQVCRTQHLNRGNGEERLSLGGIWKQIMVGTDEGEG